MNDDTEFPRFIVRLLKDWPYGLCYPAPPREVYCTALKSENFNTALSNLSSYAADGRDFWVWHFVLCRLKNEISSLQHTTATENTQYLNWKTSRLNVKAGAFRLESNIWCIIYHVESIIIIIIIMSCTKFVNCLTESQESPATNSFSINIRLAESETFILKSCNSLFWYFASKSLHNKHLASENDMLQK